MDDKEYLIELEKGIAKLPQSEQGKVFRSCAEKCVNTFVMKEMRRQFEECGKSLDAQYTKYGHTEYFFAEIIEPGHKYEMGYPHCFCPMVNNGLAKSPVHCECSRQSIIYVLKNLLPGKDIDVKIKGTVLSGANECRFIVTVK